MSRASFKGYAKALAGTEIVLRKDAVLDSTTYAGKKKQKFRDQNLVAITEILIACQDEYSISAVKQGVTEPIPSGDTRLACEGLSEKKESRTNQTLVEVKRKLNVYCNFYALL